MSGASCQSGGDGGGDRYGKKQLEHMATSLASEDYLKDNARHCPHCNAPIEKNEGCNKITCWRCGTNFCWLCGAKLNQQNPYSHFNIVGGERCPDQNKDLACQLL